MAPTVQPWERFTILPYTKEGESWQWNCHWPKALTRLPPQSPRPATATITSKLIATKKSWSVSSFETSFDPACLKACAVGLDASRPLLSFNFSPQKLFLALVHEASSPEPHTAKFSDHLIKKRQKLKHKIYINIKLRNKSQYTGATVQGMYY